MEKIPMVVNNNPQNNYYLDINKINSTIHDGLIYLSQIEYNQESFYLRIPVYAYMFNQKKLKYKNIFKKVYLVPMVIYDLIFSNFKNIDIKDYAKIDLYFCNQLKYKKGKFILYADPDLKIYVYGESTHFRFISTDNIIGYTELTSLNFLAIEKLGIKIF